MRAVTVFTPKRARVVVVSSAATIAATTVLLLVVSARRAPAASIIGPQAGASTATLVGSAAVESRPPIEESSDTSAGQLERLTPSGEEPLDVRMPSLADWVHPVLGSTELVPTRASRKFGAKRYRDLPTMCGRGGHCGLDLSGPRGTPIVAVAWGEVVRVQRVADDLSGKYVRIRHPEGAETGYMHLDSIPADLRVGDEVQAGQRIGTLGRTAIARGEAHLHFNLRLPTRGGGFRFIDSTRFLRRATVLDR